MKKSLLILITAIFSLSVLNTTLVAQLNEANAKKTVENFFSLCKANNFKGASNILAYYGKDKTRIYNDFFNPNNPDEFKEVTATLLISDSYSFGKFRDKVIDGMKLKSLDVEFLSGKQKVKQKILLLEIKGQIAIFDYH